MVQALALSRQPHVVVATPGRLADHLRSTDTVHVGKIKFLVPHAMYFMINFSLSISFLFPQVLDEADRLLEKSFEDDLSVIFDSIPEKRQTLLFSATLTDNLNRLKDLSSSTPFCWEAPTESANK